MKKIKQTRLFEKQRIRFFNNSLLIDGSILVFGDLHLGFQEHFYGIPSIQLKEIFESLKEIFKLLDKEKIILKKIIILGDLKYRFGDISDREWRESVKLFDFLLERCKDIVIVKGNHDVVLGPIARKRKVSLKDYYKYEDIIFMHGHKLYKEILKDKDCKIFILGHLHPCITLTDKYKRERYKCFLVGKYKRKLIYILPSFSDVGLGCDLSKSGYFKYKNYLFIDERKLEDFEVIIYNNENKKEYDFGKLKKLI